MKRYLVVLVVLLLCPASSRAWNTSSPATGVNSLATATLPCAVGQVPRLGSQGWGCGAAIADLTAPGPIGAATASSGRFTTLTAQVVDVPIPIGSAGEIQLAEDPANGQQAIILRAPATLAADVLLILPAQGPTAEGQCLRAHSDGTLYFSSCSP